MAQVESMITEELIERTYSFCYQRLQNPEDARDLAQEILCEALHALSRGRPIQSFQGWYWRMARNRYAVLLNRRNHSPSIYPMEDYLEDLLLEPSDPMEQMVLEEELSRMHAVIARLSGIHREILVQYYLKGNSIREIAEQLRIPEGTVKRRLFDARQEAKEGMEHMPRVTELSYVPQELELWISQGLSGEEVFQDLMGRQILSACYEKPKSIQKLSEELQIAPVYLEDKIWRMEAVGVLRHFNKNKYHTAFIIFSKNVVREMLQDIEGIYLEMCETAYRTVHEHWKEIQEIGFYGRHFSEKYRNLVFLFLAINRLGACCIQEYHRSEYWKEIYPEDFEFYHMKARRIMGQLLPADETLSEYEVKALEWWYREHRIETVSGNVFTVCDTFITPDMPENRILELHGYNVEFLYELGKNSGRHFSEQEETVLTVLLKNGLVEKREGKYEPGIIIFEKEQAERLHDWLGEQLSPYAKKYALQLAEKIDGHLLPGVRRDLLEQYYNYVVNIFLMPSSNMMWWCNEHHLITDVKAMERSGAGLFMVKS